MKFKVVLRYLIILTYLVGCRSRTADVLLSTASVIEKERETAHVIQTPNPTDTLEPIKTVTKVVKTPESVPTNLPTATETLTIEPTPTFAAGETRVAKNDGMVMVFIPEGKFLMGSEPEDHGMDADESPQHSVLLSAYWLDQTEVTNAAFVLFLNKEGNQLEGGASWYQTPDGNTQIWQSNNGWEVQHGKESYPVGGVTWYGARAYCTWAGRRLPTEAEWEKAARGTDGRTYPWGDKINCTKALYNDCGKTQVVAVDQYLEGASPFGVLGLAGSMWEWVADRYSSEYYSFSPQENPTGPTEGDYFVLRSGSYLYDWKHVRSANRRHNAPYNSKPDYGFRCAQGIE